PKQKWLRARSSCPAALRLRGPTGLRHVSRRGLRLPGALPGLQMARKCRSGKALAATRQNDAAGSPDKAQRAAIREESGRDGFAFVEAFLPV
ncbi:hypothetical protein, partial [Klebsiella pneumoniae]|uniref:hypothetical protein n=1 Tax=Klebsiella pneumoniae TaxID=573 RepID=UPI002D7C4B9F|nr:hypothetical protein [Klebsiella pneumoniae]